MKRAAQFQKKTNQEMSIINQLKIPILEFHLLLKDLFKQPETWDLLKEIGWQVWGPTEF